MLSLALIALYVAFMLALAFEPEMLGAAAGSGSSSPVIWGLGLILLFLTFILATVYFKRVSSEFAAMDCVVQDPSTQVAAQPIDGRPISGSQV